MTLFLAVNGWDATEWVTLLLAVAVGLPAWFVTLQLTLASAVGPRRKPPAESPDVPRPTAAVLVPAHNEEAGLGTTLTAVRGQLRPPDRLLVVADNCVDTTADVARAHGAQVVERHDAERRGKGFALAAGLEFLAADPPAVIVIMDADVVPAAGAVEALVRQAAATGRASQAVYLLRRQPGLGGRQVMGQIAFTMRNHVRPLGLYIAGGPCLLTGAGMAFPWGLLTPDDLASADIVEDMTLALDLADRNACPQFCPRAVVHGDPLATWEASARQRQRWEHGHLRNILLRAPRTFVGAVLRGRIGAAVLAADLAVPPLSLLIMLQVAVFVPCAVTWGVWGVFEWPAWVSGGTLLVLATLLLACYVRFTPGPGRLRDLAGMPAYVVSKIPLYARFLYRPHRHWTRSDRPAADGVPPSS